MPCLARRTFWLLGRNVTKGFGITTAASRNMGKAESFLAEKLSGDLQVSTYSPT